MVAAAATLAIDTHGLGKIYRPNSKPIQRLRAALKGGDSTSDGFWALRDVSLQVRKGESIGIIGCNGAGKSTLLQLLCGTLTPTVGSVRVDGRIAALLELGAGFNPDFSGRDNVLLNGPLLGLGREQLMEKMESIIDFSGIGHFIDQPVKTYSSGMFVRLAFSLATSVEPDILVIDEALSVGDGEFSRKSFDRIFAMKERGTTILFCSHSLYQVEAFCSRVMWLDAGRVQAIGEPHDVVRQYDLFLAAQNARSAQAGAQAQPADAPASTTPGYARISRVSVSVDGAVGQDLHVRPGESTLAVAIEFESDPALPAPTAGITIDLPSRGVLTCAVARTDGIALERDAQGRGAVTVEFPRVPLRKGLYHVGVHLAHENAVHLYDSAVMVAKLNVNDVHPEPGFVSLPHFWHSRPGHARGG